MKRSEMVEHLINAIVDNIPEISDVTFEESSNILKRLEELGMKITYRVVDSNYENDLWNLALSNWDEEDEKK